MWLSLGTPWALVLGRDLIIFVVPWKVQHHFGTVESCKTVTTLTGSTEHRAFVCDAGKPVHLEWGPCHVLRAVNMNIMAWRNMQGGHAPLGTTHAKGPSARQISAISLSGLPPFGAAGCAAY
jgi:hypothetical protein